MADDASPLNTLNEHQRRHFAVVLGALEDALVRIETLAAHDTADGRELTQVDHDLPAAFAQRAAPLLASALLRLRALSATLRLEPRELSIQRTIRAVLTSQIVHLEDSKSGQLRGYGALDPAAGHAIDRELDILLGDLEALKRALY